MSAVLGSTFRAAFDSECPDCGHGMEEGDLVGYVDNQVVCDACFNEADLENERELMALSGVTPGLLPGHTAVEPALQAIVDKAQAMEAPAVPEVLPAVDVAALIAAGQAKLQQEQQAATAPTIDVAALIAAGQAKLEAEADAMERAEVAGWTDTPAGPEVDPGHGDPWTAAAAEDPEDPWGPPAAPNLLGQIAWELMAEDEARLQADLLLKAQQIPEAPLERLDYALDQLAPYRGGKDPDAVIEDAMGVIHDAIINHPRSLQVEIGPSEIGTECDHCLAAKLAGWKERRGSSWLPTIGTAVHAWIQEQYERKMALLPPRERRWLTEARVYCGDIAGQRITGSTDLLDLFYGQSMDWKLVGVTTLKQARSIGASQVYRTQQQIYAHGWNMAGVRVDHCSIMYLPRNSMSLQDAYPVTEAYDPDVALAAFERANKFADMLAKMAHLPVEQRDAFISLLPRKRDKNGVIDCWECKRYSDFPEAEKTQLDQTMGGLVDPDD